jgi:hypothetical protein
MAKKPSTALSKDAEVGVKWKVHLGRRASHWHTFGCLRAAYCLRFAPLRLACLRGAAL